MRAATHARPWWPGRRPRAGDGLPHAARDRGTAAARDGAPGPTPSARRDHADVDRRRRAGRASRAGRAGRAAATRPRRPRRRDARLARPGRGPAAGGERLRRRRVALVVVAHPLARRRRARHAQPHRRRPRRLGRDVGPAGHAGVLRRRRVRQPGRLAGGHARRRRRRAVPRHADAAPPPPARAVARGVGRRRRRVPRDRWAQRPRLGRGRARPAVVPRRLRRRGGPGAADRPGAPCLGLASAGGAVRRRAPRRPPAPGSRLGRPRRRTGRLCRRVAPLPPARLPLARRHPPGGWATSCPRRRGDRVRWSGRPRRARPLPRLDGRGPG